MTVVLGGDAAAIELFSMLRERGPEPTLVLPEEPAEPVDGDAVIEAQAMKTVRMEHRVCGLMVHRDDDGTETLPGPVVAAGRRPTKLWTGDGGLGCGLALGLLAGADPSGLADLGDDGPRGGLLVDDDGRTGVSGLYAAGGATGVEGPDIERVAETVAEARVPSRVPTEAPPEIDAPMPDGFSKPKIDRLAELMAEVRPDADGDRLEEIAREVRGLLGEMRSYLQARRSEELLRLRDGVVVAMGVVQACRTGQSAGSGSSA